MRRRGALSRWLPVVLWAACISEFSTGLFTGDRTGSLIIPVLASLFPSARPERLLAIHHGLRKLAHFTEYLILSLLLYRALRDSEGRVRAAVWAVVISGCYAVLDEFHQSFVPGRTPAAADALIDLSGAATGQGVLAARRRPTAS